MTNPLRASGQSRPAYITVGNEQVPIDIEGYCAWANEKNARRGRFVLSGKAPERIIQYQESTADTEAYLRKRGLLPDLSIYRNR